MNAEQKQRAAELLAAWQATAYALHGDRMANLLQELIDAPEDIAPAHLIDLPPVGDLQIDAAPAHAELPTWENGDDPLVGGGLISRGKVDFTALGIWPSKPAPEAEPVARVTGYCAGYLSVATVDGRVLPTGTALYTAPPAPSVPEVATATNPSQISSFTEPGAWRYVIPGRRRTEKFDSSRVGDYNQGWNDCRNITEKALNDLEKRK